MNHEDGLGGAAAGLNRLRIEVGTGPCFGEARIVVDGVDWIDLVETDGIGLDPRHLAAELVRGDGWTTVGLCSCGCIGCGDICVEVRRRDGVVEWGDTGLRFSAEQHDEEVARFSTIAPEDVSGASGPSR